MDRNERKVLFVIAVITLSLLGFFWWLGNLASRKEMDKQRAAQAERAERAEGSAPSYAAATGRLVDAATGEPVPGVRVLAWTALEPRPPERSPLLLEAVSRQDGVFVFSKVPLAGDGRPPRLALDSADDFYYLADYIEPGTLPPPGEGTEPGTLAPPGGAIEPGTEQPAVVAVMRGGAVAGQVLDPAGAPCTGALVLLEKAEATPGAGDDSGWAGPRRLIGTVQTDASGWFVFPRLPAGNDVRATAYHPKHASGGVEQAAVAAGERTVLSLALSAGAVVAGQVLDAENKPVSGAYVAPCGPPSDRSKVLRASILGAEDRLLAGLVVRTDTNGAFRLVRPVGETLCLRAQAPGQAPGYSRQVAAAADSGGAAAEVVIVLPASARITGLVRTPDDKPVAGANIAATAVLGPETYRAAAASDTGGAFTVGPVPAGAAATLSIAAPGLGEKTLSGVAPGGEGVTVILEPAVALSGTVVSADTREPVPLFRVFARPAGGATGPILTASGKDGSFTFDALAPGRWNFAVSADGFESATLENVTLQAGAEPPIVAAALPPSASISGRFLVGRDEPVAGARVTPIHQAPEGVLRREACRSSATGPDGAFTLRGLPAGNYIIEFFREAPPLIWHHGPVRLAPGGTVADLAVAAGRSAGGLEVTVLGPDGQPAAGARVDVRPGSGPWLPGEFSGFAAGADGKVAIERLAPGRKIVAAFLFEGGDPAGAVHFSEKRPVTITSGKTEAVTLSFAGLRLCEVAGTITRGGAPAGGGRVRAVPVLGEMPDLEAARFAAVDSGGQYAFPALPAGRYLLALEPGPRGGAFEPLSARPVLIAPAEGKARLDFEIAAGTISGVVRRSPGGSPAPRASVYLHALAAAPGGAGGGTQVAAAMAGPDGSFAFAGLAPGNYLIAATAVGSAGAAGVPAAAAGVPAAPAGVPAAPAGDAAGHVETGALAGGQQLANVEVVVAPAGCVAVTAVDESGKPVSGATVAAQSTGGGAITPARQAVGLTDGRGQALLHPLEPGGYRLVVASPGAVARIEPAVVVEAAKTTLVDTVLASGPQVTLTLKDARGEPVTQCRLAVFGPDNAWVGPPMGERGAGQAELAGAGGEYVLGGYPPGAYTVHVMAAGLRPRTAAFTVPPEGAPAPIAITLEPTGA